MPLLDVARSNGPIDTARNCMGTIRRTETRRKTASCTGRARQAVLMLHCLIEYTAVKGAG